ncbi:serine hydrolase domain-containing protein [Streptomyces sp. NRRL F-2580]|uniref:serine hydrolase domain-containing protein n=1 Tax=Streptomyces sp. NRRL F-2580 TaxID=1463841 RepID=UPI00068D1F9C|nr:serine hydrolase domain-containing protein [Streptomyces sp. NRRL F-2580]
MTTNSAKSAFRKARWITLVAAGAAVASLAISALPASAQSHPAPASGTGTGTVFGHRPSVDEEALAKAMAPGGVAAGTMVRVSGPGVRWTKATGPLSQDPAASFRIGSMTKVFTSTVVLQLVAEGRFTLDTPIREVLPDTVPAHWKPITIGQLLSHTSGLGMPCGTLQDGMGLTPDRVVAAWTREGCPAPEYPVTRQQYNGGNYFILGLAIEKVTGRSYAEEVQRRIARPLGLRHTYVPQAGDASMPTPSLAAPTPKEPWAWAEGGMISNAPDMERFMKALLGGRLLPPAQQRQLFVKPELSKAAKEQPYSQGGLTFHTLSDGTEIWGKTGSMAQYSNGVFGTRHGARIATWSFLPTPEAAKEDVIDRVTKILEAAL